MSDTLLKAATRAACNADLPCNRFNYPECVGPNCSCWQHRLTLQKAAIEAYRAGQPVHAVAPDKSDG